MADTETSTVLKPGDHLTGDYRLEHRLSGDIGRANKASAVFGATDCATGQRRAIRCWFGPHGATAAAATQHFIAAAQQSGLFEQPHITPVYAVGEAAGTHYAVMEWLNGFSLDQFFQRVGPLTVPQAFDVLVPCIGAVARAHAAGIVHGDLRPANIFLCRTENGERERPRVMNFGFGNWTDQPLIWQSSTKGARDYVAPEVLRSEGLDQRSDVYAFGVLLYTLLAGKPPCSSDNIDDFSFEGPEDARIPLAERLPGLATGVAAIVERAMSSEPGDRYQSLDEMLTDIGAIDMHRPRLSSSINAPAEQPFVWVKVPLESKPPRESVALAALAEKRFERSVTKPVDVLQPGQVEPNVYDGSDIDDPYAYSIYRYKRHTARHWGYAGVLALVGCWGALGIHLFSEPPERQVEVSGLETQINSAWDSIITRRDSGDSDDARRAMEKPEPTPKDALSEAPMAQQESDSKLAIPALSADAVAPAAADGTQSQ